MTDKDVPSFEDAKKDIQNGGWSKYAVYVLNALERLEDNDQRLFEFDGQRREDLAVIKTKVIMYGVIVGFVTATIVSIAVAFIGHS